MNAAASLTYGKWGTRIAACDEGDEGLQSFAFDGARDTAEGNGWEILHGPVERVRVGAYDGDEVFAYLWPVARPNPAGGAR